MHLNIRKWGLKKSLKVLASRPYFAPPPLLRKQQTHTCLVPPPPKQKYIFSENKVDFFKGNKTHIKWFSQKPLKPNFNKVAVI